MKNFLLIIPFLIAFSTFAYTQEDAIISILRKEKGIKIFALESSTYKPFDQTKEDDGEWIHWDDGTNFTGVGYSGPGEFAVASRWEEPDLADYDGMLITQISFFPKEVNATYSLRIWTGYDHTSVYTQDVETVTIGEWNTVELEIPYQIDASDEMMFGYYIVTEAGHPAGCDAGPAVGGKGDMLYDLDNGWVGMADSYGLNYNWNLQACVISGPDTYNVTFNLQKGEEPNFDPVNDTIYITGSMFGWTVPGSDPDNQMMTRIEDTWIWTKTLQLQADEYQYKYFLNHGWTGGEWDGEPNRVVTVMGDTEVNDCWNPFIWRITFIVTDKNQIPIENAAIEIFDESHNFEDEIITNQEGIAEIWLGCCSFTFTITVQGYHLFNGAFESCQSQVIPVVLTPIAVEVDFISGLEIFPNPFKGNITIMNTSAISKVIITNLIGQKVLETNALGSERMTIPTDGLVNGIYLIVIEAENGERVVRRMVKE